MARRDRLGRAVPDGVHLHAEREVLAECLWELGEEELAERALALSDAELEAVGDLALWHRHHHPDPPGGPRVTNGRTLAWGMIDLVEGAGRDTARRRRRTRPEAQRYTA